MLKTKPAPLPLSVLHDLLGHNSRMLADIQKLRIAMGNRIGAMERDELIPPSQYGDGTAPVMMMRSLEEAEGVIARELERLARQHFMADWIKAQRGIGLPGFARLLGITGPLDNFATVSKLWKYLGLHVTEEGTAPKKLRGHKLDYSPQGRTLCYLLGESIVKVGKGGPYREAYDQKKAYYEAERVDWTQAHRHHAAMRYAVKLLIRDMWVAWRQRQQGRSGESEAIVPQLDGRLFAVVG